MFIYSHFFNESDKYKNLEYFLTRRAEELIKIRNGLFTDSYITRFEGQFVIPKMLDSYSWTTYSLPDEEYVYSVMLEEAYTILKVIDYKRCCFNRNLHKLDSDRKLVPKINELIIESIKKNPRVSYLEIINSNRDWDIATELERMIEEGEVTSIACGKKDDLKSRVCYVDYPKQKWVLKERPIP